jgi:hypothetical protein
VRFKAVRRLTFSTDPGRDEAAPSACGSEGETLDIVVTGEHEPLAIGVVYMKFVVDTARVARSKELAASGLLDGGRNLVQADKGQKTFLDDWAKTGQSIL